MDDVAKFACNTRIDKLCAWRHNRPICSRVRPDVRDRRQTDRCQTSDRRQTKASLNACYGGGGIIIVDIVEHSNLVQRSPQDQDQHQNRKLWNPLLHFSEGSTGGSGPQSPLKLFKDILKQLL